MQSKSLVIPVTFSQPQPQTDVSWEDFSSIRQNGAGLPLWSPYLGENANQSGGLVTGGYQLVVNKPNTGSSYAYLQFLPLYTNTLNYNWPQSYAQSWIRSGTFDPNCNRLTFWVKPDHRVMRRSDGGVILECGTYIRSHGTTDYTYAGDHYYHQMDPNLYANQWMKFTLNRQPQHKVSGSGLPALDPTYPSLHYYDGLTRWYFNGLRQAPSNDPNFDPGWVGKYIFSDFRFATVANEPDSQVCSVATGYTGTCYEATWMANINTPSPYTFDVAYSTTSMKAGGFASGTYGGKVSFDPSGYSGALWQSPPMAQQQTFFIAIRPNGQSLFSEFAVPFKA